MVQAFEAIAIIAVDNSNGTWQYSTNNGVSWANVDDGSLAVNHALLLDGSLVGVNTHKLRFVPTADYHGNETITFRAWDKTSGSVGTYVDTSTSGNDAAFSSMTDTASIIVNSINDQPVASDVVINATEDGSTANGSFSVTDNDSSDTHTFNILSSPSEGSVVNNHDGTFAFNPGSDFQDLALGETQLVSFSYTATDSSGWGNDTSTAKTVTVTVTGVNDRPVAGDVAIFSPTEDGSSVIGSFVEADTDSSDTHTFNILSSPSEGTVVNNNNRTFTFDPGSDFQDLALGETRLVSFSYTATDSSGSGNATSTAKMVTMTVTGVNDQPVAGDVAIGATEDGPSVIGSFVETDADSSDTHTFNILSSPSEGSVVNNNDGTFTFDPGSDFQDLALGETRLVSFSYTATDSSGSGNATSTTKTVTVTVTGVNDRPVAGDVAIGAAEDGSSVNGSFIATDADSSNTTHTFNILSGPSEGDVVNNNDGTFTFDPGSDFQDLAQGETRLVSFGYTATDSSGSGSATSTAKTVTVTVTGVNDRPVASNIATTVSGDGGGVIRSFIGTDADSSDTHTFNILSSPSEGNVVNNNDGTFTFDPGSDFQDLTLGETRLVSFSYSVTDSSGSGSATSTAKTVTITVTELNDQPVVSDVAIMATEDGAAVNGNFIVTDVDSSDTHTFNILSSPSEGNVVNNNDGTFTFDPGSDFQDLALGETRLVSFSYTATDNSGSGNATSTAKTVTVTVTGVNDRPVADDVAISATEDGGGVNGSFIETDADSSDTHSFTLISSPSEGSMVNNNDGAFTFDPGSDFQDLALGETRLVSFSYTATDSSGSGQCHQYG